MRRACLSSRQLTKLRFMQDKWSAVYNVRTILLSIQSLLGEPNNDSPLNGYAAALWPNQEGKPHGVICCSYNILVLLK